MPLPENIVPRQETEVNGDSGEGYGPFEQEQPGIKGTGAAERNFAGTAAYDDLLTDDNVQRSRPDDVRSDEVPKQDAWGHHVSETVSNAKGKSDL